MCVSLLQIQVNHLCFQKIQNATMLQCKKVYVEVESKFTHPGGKFHIVLVNYILLELLQKNRLLELTISVFNINLSSQLHQQKILSNCK